MSWQPSRSRCLQTVRSGDPLLAGVLAENVANHPGERFLWLVDEDDLEARRITAGLSATAEAANAAVILIPPLPPGTNPKVFKLALAQDRCGELIAVLDDDTVLPAGALDRARRELRRGDLVTGLPMYRPGRGLYGRLVAAFVNGSALVTYLPVLWFTRPVTINGMFYLTRRTVLESLGGFAAIEDRLCDDYEMAKLYRRGGRRIVQSTIVHPLCTTVPGLRAYSRLMRRWMFCTGQLFREELPLAAWCWWCCPRCAARAGPHGGRREGSRSCLPSSSQRWRSRPPRWLRTATAGRTPAVGRRAARGAPGGARRPARPAEHRQRPGAPPHGPVAGPGHRGRCGDDHQRAPRPRVNDRAGRRTVRGLPARRPPRRRPRRPAWHG